MSVVNFDYGYIFMHEPHTGGRSIEKALMQHNGSINFNGDHHISAMQMIHGKYITRDQYDRFTKFRFVRDPYDYLVTVWITHNKKRTEFVNWVLGPALSHMVNGTLFWRYDHCAQYNLRFEDLEHDLNCMLSTIGVPQVELEHIGKIEDKPTWEDLVSDTPVYLEQIYPDIERFGYKRERNV